MQQIHTYLWSRILAGAVLILAPAAALAAGAAAATQSSAGGLEEITVTAERYSSTLQTTPIAITALNADALELREITSVREATSQIPGVLMTSTTGSTSGARIFMRGVGDENTAILFDSAVGVYIDNVYQPRINGQFYDFFDIERLEVLRGPQGTLYGRNTSGGAIKIVTRTPSFTPTASGDLAYGSYSQTDARVYLSGPLLGETLAGSLSAVTRTRDGWTHDANYDRDLNNKNQQALRAKLLYKPNDRLSAELAYQVMRDNSDAGLGSQVQLLGGLGVVNPKAVPGRNLFESELSGPQYNDADNNGATLNLSYAAAPNVTLNSITGWGRQAVNLATMYVQTVSGLNIGTSYYFNDKFLSEEANATVKSDRFKGVAGLFYFSEKGHEIDGPPYTSLASQNIRDRKTDTWAVYAEGTYTIVEGVGVTVGLRHTSEKARLTQFYYNQTALTPAPQSAETTFTSTTPKFGLNWQATNDLLLYASYTKGFKSGGFNAVSPSTNIGGPPGTIAGPLPYGPEKVTSYEGGLKFTTTDRRLRVNLAVFQAEYDGLQLPVFFPGTVNTYTYNATSARVRGIEVEPTWQVTDSFQVYGVGAFQEDKYTAPFLCALYNTQIVNCQSNKLKGVIPTKTTVGFLFAPKLSISGQVSLSGDWEHNSKYFNNVSNTLPIVQTPEEDIFNAALSWEGADRHWKLALEGRNLANKQYPLESLQISSPVQASVTAYPNDPRTYDVRIRYNF